MKSYEKQINEALSLSELGLEKYKKKDYVGAVEVFALLIEQNKDNFFLYILRGTSYEDLGDDYNAKKDFEIALSIYPENYLAAYRLGMVYFRSQDLENAIKMLKISYDNQENVGAFGLVSNEFYTIGKNNSFYVDKKVIAANLGNFLTQVKKYDEALVYLNKAINIDPTYAFPYITMGVILDAFNRKSEAIDYYYKGLELGYPNRTHIVIALNRLVKETVKVQKNNPLNIVDDPVLNSEHQIPNYVEAFADDLLLSFKKLQYKHGDVRTNDFITLITYYYINLLINYRDNAMATLPKSVVNDMKNQILEALQRNFDFFNQKETINLLYNQLDTKIWEDNIIEETQNYVKLFFS